MILSIYAISLYCNIKHLLKLENICINLDLPMTNASILRILAHATPTPTSRSKGQKSKSRGGAYCGGHLAAQLVLYVLNV